MQIEQKIIDRLIDAYNGKNSREVAKAIDEQIDRSGNLLGWLRQLAWKHIELDIPSVELTDDLIPNRQVATKLEPLSVGLDTAAKLCSVSRGTLMQWVDKGLLPTASTGGKRLVLISDLRACLESLKNSSKRKLRGAASKGF